MKIIHILIKNVQPVNIEVLVDLKNIEIPGVRRLKIQTLIIIIQPTS